MNFEKKNNISNLINLIKNDSIGRNKYLLKMLNILSNGNGSNIYALDGDWGSGKTFFVSQMNLLINYSQSYSEGKVINENLFFYKSFNFDEIQLKELDCIFKTERFKKFSEIVKENGVNSIYFNAWEHDDEDEPIISIIYQLINDYDLYDELYCESGVKKSKLIGSIVKAVSAGTIDVDGVVNVKDFSENQRMKGELKLSIKNIFNELINENCNRLIIFIDELDRCIPSYAVKLLERIKHYFDDERIVVVISTNIRELSNTIKNMYGNDFSAEKYLDKFFDLRLVLPSVNIDNYLRTINTKYTNSSYSYYYVNMIISSIIKHYHLQMREIDRYVTMLNYFSKHLYSNKNYWCSLNYIIDYLFLPFVIYLYSFDYLSYSSFIKGNNYNVLKELITNCPPLTRVVNRFIFKSDSVDDEKDYIKEMEVFYNYLFSNLSESSNLKIGDYVPEIENNIYDVISLLGDISSFNDEE